MTPIIAKDNRRDFRPAPEGLHSAVCVDVVDRGIQTSQWGTAHKVELRWQINEINPDTDRRFVVMRRYSLSMNEKSTLSQHLEAWRGRPFTKQERAGFDLEGLIGNCCQVQLVHYTTPDGTTYANVQTCVPVAKGMPRLRPLDYVRDKDRAVNSGPTFMRQEGTAASDPDGDLPF